MRTHIAKALQKRSKAIQRAVKTYNTVATALDPPKPTIDWNTVSHYKFLEEFPLLRNTSQDLTGKRWALPAVRETMKQWRRVCRAREEVIRCNVEVRRLHTSIVDEETSFQKILAQSAVLGPIHGAVSNFIKRRTRVNIRLLQKISKIYDLEGFSGIASPGVRQVSGTLTPQDDEMQVENEVTELNVGKGGNFEHIQSTSGQELQLTSQAPENEIDDSSDSEDETYAEGVVNILDFVSELQ
jgi:hypothetical protein